VPADAGDRAEQLDDGGVRRECRLDPRVEPGDRSLDGVDVR